MLAVVLLAVAMPTTLTCTIHAAGKNVVMSVRLDEALGSVRYAWPATATPVTSRALFAQGLVMFDRFTLDRRSLAIVRDGEAVTGAIGAQPDAARGRCRAARVRYAPVNPAKRGVR